MSVCCSAPVQAVVTSPATTSAAFPRLLPPWLRRTTAWIPVGAAARPSLAVRASVLGSSSSSDFVRRIEQAWLISQQPRPIVCSTCNSDGHVECKWCRGTGFFILGDNMLCEVPSRNTTCLICAGEGSSCCQDCQGTGFRAKWLGEPPQRTS